VLRLDQFQRRQILQFVLLILRLQTGCRVVLLSCWTRMRQTFLGVLLATERSLHLEQAWRGLAADIEAQEGTGSVINSMGAHGLYAASAFDKLPI